MHYVQAIQYPAQQEWLFNSLHIHLPRAEEPLRPDPTSFYSQVSLSPRTYTFWTVPVGSVVRPSGHPCLSRSYAAPWLGAEGQVPLVRMLERLWECLLVVSRAQSSHQSHPNSKANSSESCRGVVSEMKALSVGLVKGS